MTWNRDLGSKTEASVSQPTQPRNTTPNTQKNTPPPTPQPTPQPTQQPATGWNGRDQNSQVVNGNGGDQSQPKPQPEPKPAPVPIDPPLTPTQPKPELSIAVNTAAAAFVNSNLHNSGEGASVVGGLSVAGDSSKNNVGLLNAGVAYKSGNFAAIVSALYASNKSPGLAAGVGVRLSEKVSLVVNAVSMEKNNDKYNDIRHSASVGVGVQVTENVNVNASVGRGITETGKKVNLANVDVGIKKDNLTANLGFGGAKGDGGSSVVGVSFGVSYNRGVEQKQAKQLAVPTPEKTPQPEAVGLSLDANKIFAFNKSELIDTAELDKLVSILSQPQKSANGLSIADQLKNSNGSINLIGRTDAFGSDKYNQSLSERRAKEVNDYLVKELKELTGRDYQSIFHFKGEGEKSAQLVSNEEVAALTKAKNTKSGMKAYEEAKERAAEDRRVDVSIAGGFLVDPGNGFTSMNGNSGKLTVRQQTTPLNSAEQNRLENMLAKQVVQPEASPTNTGPAPVERHGVGMELNG